jgi:uncharacterized OB-fold protein
VSEVSETDHDWTAGEPAIHHQTCRKCGGVWYFRREFCPRCGDDSPLLQRASGWGTVAAVSTVHRAPSAELRQHAPYCILLVEADEGFRMMAQGDRSLSIGDRVTAGFVKFGEGFIPYFTRHTP